MKRKLSLILTLVICLVFSSNNLAGAEVTSTQKEYINSKFDQAIEKDEGILGEVYAVDSSGLPLKNGHVIVYSYFENKNVARFELDENGYAALYYEPDKNLILEQLKEKAFVDTHYLLVIGNYKEVVTEGLTKTYYLNEMSEKTISNIKVNNNYKAENVIKTKSEKFENIKDAIVVKNDEDMITPQDVFYPVHQILQSQYLGSKRVKFAQISSTYGCKVFGQITQGTETEINGENVVKLKFTYAGSSAAISGWIDTPSPCIEEFFTFYDFYEDYCVYNGGPYSIYFYRVRPNQWQPGIDYSSYYYDLNAYAYNYVKNMIVSTWRSGTTAAFTSSATFTYGAAASFTGPLSGTTYSLSLTHKLTDLTSLQRRHDGPDYYYDWGSNDFLTKRGVINTPIVHTY